MDLFIDKDKQVEVKQFFERVTEANEDYFQYWYTHTLWHWDFWFSVVLSLLPWIIWIAVRRKESQGRLLLAGMFIIILASWMDFIGVVCGAWYYSGKALPTIPSYVPWDFCMLPVSMMLTLQFKPRCPPWIKALIYAALTAFGGETLFKWLGFYIEEHWRVFYSFPIYIVLYLICDKICRTKSFDPLAP